MNVLVIGSGGREHALVWKIAQNPEVKNIYAIPGNGGICQQAECASIPLTDFPALIEFVRTHHIDFTVVGPEQPLVAGIADAFRAEGLPIFGPGAAGARIEGSKIFAKELMQKHGIPTAHFGTFSDYDAALKYLRQLPEGPVVVKADGLAAGKGSVVCANHEEARQALHSMMVEKVFRNAGEQVVIEEFMQGEEASLFVITDGNDYHILHPAQDFKRALDDDKGKNTGGMGSYAPTPFVTPDILERARREIVEPMLHAFQQESIEYRGVLYCGLMLTDEGPKVVEFNCRFGDPETQVVLPLMESDLLEMMLAVENGNLNRYRLQLKEEYGVCVVLASGGYPDAYQTGYPIEGLDEVPDDVLVFHAGTRNENGRLVTAGGRVLGITALAQELEAAVNNAYQAVEHIHFKDMHYRRDIARRAVNYLKATK